MKSNNFNNNLPLYENLSTSRQRLTKKEQNKILLKIIINTIIVAIILYLIPSHYWPRSHGWRGNSYPLIFAFFILFAIINFFTSFFIKIKPSAS